jgi:DNA-binding protein H-NS
MRSLTRDQLLKIFGLTSGAFDALQRAGHVALAFGTPIPATPGRYFDLDLVGMAISAGLGPTLGRQTATTIALGFFNQWVAAVGHADADTTRNYFFAIGLFGGDERRPREIRVTNGTMEQITSDLRDASSMIAVNITDIIAGLRAKGRAAGIDLSQPFFFPPEHERFSQIIAEFKEEREARIARLRRIKKKLRRHQALMSRQDIKAVARLRDAQKRETDDSACA